MWPGRKKKESSSYSLADPIERVNALSSRGLSESDIIRSMEEEGYTPTEIDSAMNEALKNAATRAGPREFLPPKERLTPDRSPEPEMERGPPMPESAFDESRGPPRPEPAEAPLPEPEPIQPAPPAPAPERAEPAGPETPRPPFNYNEFGEMRQASPEPEEPSLPGERSSTFDFPEEDISGYEDREHSRDTMMRETEELVESIVEEKWSMIRSELGDIHANIENLDSRIVSLEQSISQAQDSKNNQVKDIDSKIDTYKESISEMSSRLEAMEGAIKDSITPMMQSVRSLNETVKKMKSK